jgi:hypothetical protein
MPKNSVSLRAWLQPCRKEPPQKHRTALPKAGAKSEERSDGSIGNFNRTANPDAKTSKAGFPQNSCQAPKPLNSIKTNDFQVAD